MAYAGSVRTFNDPEAFAGSLHNCQIAIRPTARDDFRARLAMARLSDIDLALTIEAGPRRATMSMRPDRIYFRFVAPGDRPKTRNGLEDVPGSVAIGPGSAEVDDVTFGPSISRSLSVPVASMLARADSMSATDMPFLVGRTVSVLPPPATMTRIACLHREALRIARMPPGDGITARRAMALNASIWDVLTETLCATEPEPRAPRGRATMRRLMHFISANDDRRIPLHELCAVADCSAKTLEVLFLRCVGETPNRYLRRWRMWRAREALALADPGVATVSDIALACGFWELGRFAVAYRQMFGESPSETLRNGPSANTSRTAPRITKFA